MAVIGHSDCRMVNLESRKEEFVMGLPGSVISEGGLIRSQYPGVVVAPLFYSLEDDDLYLIEE
jgi:hypothetical protein